jgi:hypothetical protein
MVKPIRIVATIVFIASIILVLVAAFVLGNGVCYLTLSLIRYISDSLFRYRFRFYV